MSHPYVAVVHLPARSGITADETQNVWAFTTPGSDEATDLAAIHDRLQTFYRAVQGILSPQLGSAPQIKIYDATNALELSPPADILGAPVAVQDFTWSGGFSGTALVEEAAITLSFRGSYGSRVEFGPGTRPRAHVRGRIFLGPLNTTPLTVDATTGRTLISSGVRTTITTAAAALRSAGDVTWSVWSRRDKAFYAVTVGWVDNAFDTQRRRGPAATARTTF